jgi:flagella basal body P-ring formation protein FlgA
VITGGGGGQTCAGRSRSDVSEVTGHLVAPIVDCPSDVIAFGTVTGGIVLARYCVVLDQSVIFPTPPGWIQQLLCHLGFLRPKVRSASTGRVALGLWLLGLALTLSWPAWAQSGANSARLLTEVGAWVQQTQGLTSNEFSFAPMDSRIQTQTCDRALVMDLPFASRETVRVRCLGSPSWQLYLRLVIDPTTKLPPRKSASEVVGLAQAPASTPAAVKDAAPAVAIRRVVVARQLLRAGSLVTADMLVEVDQPATGLDAQVLRTIKEAENSEAVREIAAGVALRSYDLRRAVLVKMGKTVLLTISQAGGFSISARVEALQDGRLGDQVRLKNLESGRLVTGVVTGPNTASGL